MRPAARGEARFALHARLTPLAAVALDQLSLDARDLDLNAWDAALPATRLDVKAEGRPADGGIAGRFEAKNAIAGPIDANRLPLRSISARFAWRANEVTLDDLVAVLNRRRARHGKRTSAARTAAPASGRSTFTTSISSAFHSTLATTRLSGSLGADLDATRQSVEGRVADRGIVGGIAASFAATLVERRLAVERFQIRAGDGELAGSGAIELAGRRPFEVNAKAKRVDPSRFGKFPAGKLDGDVAATGVLDPAWQRRRQGRDCQREPSSPACRSSGKLRGTFAPRVVRDAAIDLSLASARLVATGSIGPDADGLAIAFDAPQARGARAAAARTRSETPVGRAPSRCHDAREPGARRHWSSGRTAMR